MKKQEKENCKRWFFDNHLVPNFFSIDDLKTIIEGDEELLEKHFYNFKCYAEEILMDGLSADIRDIWCDFKETNMPSDEQLADMITIKIK